MVFDGCYVALQAYARRRCPASAVDDVVAESLTIAWRRLDDIPRGAEIPWVLGVARRVLANQRRGDERRLRLFERVVSRAPVAAVGEDGTDETDAVLAVLATLRPDDQEVLRLAAWEGLQPHEIAVVLGCSANAASLRLRRARTRLRVALTESAAVRTGTTRKDGDG